MTDTRIDPFTADGVQAISLYFQGWTMPYVKVFQTAREARSYLDGEMRYWVRYVTTGEVLWYGYDPCVYNTPDEPESGILGMDGYPDFSATINLDDDNIDSITWEQA
jgi:hypothetical protein